MAASGEVTVRLAVVGGDRVVATLRGVADATSAAADATARASQRIGAAVAAVGEQSIEGTRRAGQAFTNFRGAIQQTAFQLQDVATQLSMGAPLMRTLAVQGAQMAGAFGPLGAVLGAVATAAVVAWTALGQGQTVSERTTAAIESLQQTVRETSDVLGGAARSADELAESYRRLGDEGRRLAEIQLTQGIARLQAELAGIPSTAAEAVRQLRQLREAALGRTGQTPEQLIERLERSGQLSRLDELGARAEQREALEALRQQQREQLAREIAESQRLVSAVDQALQQLARGEELSTVIGQLERLARTFGEPLRREIEGVAQQILELGVAGVEAERRLRELQARLQILRGQPGPEAQAVFGRPERAAAPAIEREIEALRLERQRLEEQLSGASARAATIAAEAREREIRLARAGVAASSELGRAYLAEGAAVDELRRKLLEREEATRAAAEAARAAAEAERQIREEQQARARAEAEALERWERDPRAIVGAHRGLIEVMQQTADAGRQMQRVVEDAFWHVEDAIVSAMRTGKLEVQQLLHEIAADVTRFLVRLAIVNPIASVLGSLFGPAPAAVAAPPRPMALGGVIDRATIVPLARGAALIGEAGPEAVLPLRRLRSGRLGVEAAVGTAAAAPQIDIRVVDQRSTQGPAVSARVVERSPGRAAIEIAVRDVVASLVERGALDGPLGRRYGARPVAR